MKWKIEKGIQYLMVINIYFFIQINVMKKIRREPPIALSHMEISKTSSFGEIIQRMNSSEVSTFRENCSDLEMTVKICSELIVPYHFAKNL